MIKNKLSLAIIITTFTFTAPTTATESGMTLKDYLEKADKYIIEYQHFEASDVLKEAAKLGGAKLPALHMRLGILYYGLGLIPEAIAEGEKAVALMPSSKWYKYDLGKFYYVDKRYDEAEQQFITLLKIDPGFTLGYYYLAELYYQKKKYAMAWLSLQRAFFLGHRGKNLEIRLTPFTTKPTEHFEQVSDENKLFRFIKLSSSEQALNTLNEIQDGKLFENVEFQLKKNPDIASGFGMMMLSEFKDTVADSLRDSEPYSSPQIIKTGSDYRIIQRIMPFDIASWQAAIVAAPKKSQNQQKKQVVTMDTPVMDIPSKQVNKAGRNTVGSEEAPEIIPATTVPPEHKLSNKLAALYALESWQDAWKTQDAKAYFAAYSNHFTPENDISLEVWKKKRIRSLSRPKFIRIDIKDSVFEIISNEQIRITFKQEYKSNTYQDKVIKTLTMQKEPEGWKITREREIEKRGF